MTNPLSHGQGDVRVPAIKPFYTVGFIQKERNHLMFGAAGMEKMDRQHVHLPVFPAMEFLLTIHKEKMPVGKVIADGDLVFTKKGDFGVLMGARDAAEPEVERPSAGNTPGPVKADHECCGAVGLFEIEVFHKIRRCSAPQARIIGKRSAIAGAHRLSGFSSDRTLTYFAKKENLMGLLDGKKGLIFGIANSHSIAWHIAGNVLKQGGTCGFGHLPGEKMERRVKKAMDEGGFAGEWLYPCDVSNDASIDAFFAAVKEKFGQIDFMVHCLAFANHQYLNKVEGNFTATPREVYTQACDISAYSLIGLTRAAQPLMTNGGSVVALTYYGANKVIPGYNVMGVAKAALETTARYLAFDLGNKKIRVNTISAGPIRTLSASAVGGIDEMFDHTIRKAPLHRNVEGDEVGKTAVYLLSDLSSGVTGENIFVDCGFNVVGL